MNRSRHEDLGGQVACEQHGELREDGWIYIGKILDLHRQTNKLFPSIEKDAVEVTILLKTHSEMIGQFEHEFQYVPPPTMVREFNYKDEAKGWDGKHPVRIFHNKYKPNGCVPCSYCGRNDHDRDHCRLPDPCEFCGAQDHPTRICNSHGSPDSNNDESRDPTPRAVPQIPRGPRNSTPFTPSPSPPQENRGGGDGAVSNASRWSRQNQGAGKDGAGKEKADGGSKGKEGAEGKAVRDEMEVDAGEERVNDDEGGDDEEGELNDERAGDEEMMDQTATPEPAAAMLAAASPSPSSIQTCSQTKKRSQDQLEEEEVEGLIVSQSSNEVALPENKSQDDEEGLRVVQHKRSSRRSRSSSCSSMSSVRNSRINHTQNKTGGGNRDQIYGSLTHGSDSDF